jgi:hypothetical protein
MWRWQDPREIGGPYDLESVLGGAVKPALQDPAVQGAISDVILQTLERDDVRAVVRGYAIEGALTLGVGIAAGLLAFNLLRSR